MRDGSLTEWLSSLSILAVGLMTLTLMLVAGAVGHLVRRYRDRRQPQESGESAAQEGYLVSGALGLLALLLAFTFGLVLNRYETRRELVTQEANAIGTAYLRAQLLDEPHRSRLSRLLVDYTDNRIKLAAAGADREARLSRNDRLLTDIWAAVSASRDSALAHGITTPLLTTFNEVIDVDTERKISRQLRVPTEVALLLLAYLVVTAAVLGHAVEGPRGRRAAVVLFTLFALSISVITDLNRPGSGRIRESQKPLIMLLQSLRSQPPEVFDRFNMRPGPAKRAISGQ